MGNFTLEELKIIFTWGEIYSEDHPKWGDIDAPLLEKLRIFIEEVDFTKDVTDSCPKIS